MNSSSVPVFSAIDLARMLCAVLIAAAGAVACLLFLARAKRKDYSLLYFGVLALLYGIRLFINGSAAYMHNRWERIDLGISLLAAIPLILFVVETVALRWKKLAWWLIAALSAIAAFGFGNLWLRRDLRIVGVTTNIIALGAIPIL